MLRMPMSIGAPVLGGVCPCFLYCVLTRIVNALIEALFLHAAEEVFDNIIVPTLIAPSHTRLKSIYRQYLNQASRLTANLDRHV